MSRPNWNVLTPAQYLARERVTRARSEFCDGVMSSMTSGSRAHSLICANVIHACETRLATSRDCETHAAGLRVTSTETGLYTYPDVTIVRGETEFEDKQRDTLINPTVLFEVLSPATEAYDRGRKFEHYARITSLRHYVLIDQFRAHVDLMSLEDTGWTTTAADGLDTVLTLPAVDLQLPLREIYHGVALPENTAQRPRP